jgi:hypothetical protein
MRQRHELLLWTAQERAKSCWFGRPFYRAQQAVRLIESYRWNQGRRIVLAVAVTWVALVLITLLFNPHAIRSLLDAAELLTNGNLNNPRKKGRDSPRSGLRDGVSASAFLASKSFERVLCRPVTGRQPIEDEVWKS